LRRRQLTGDGSVEDHGARQDRDLFDRPYRRPSEDDALTTRITSPAVSRKSDRPLTADPGLLACGSRNAWSAAARRYRPGWPARTRTTPSFGIPQIQEPHSDNQPGTDAPTIGGALKLARLDPERRKAISETTIAIENALLVKRWQSVQWHV